MINTVLLHPDPPKEPGTPPRAYHQLMVGGERGQWWRPLATAGLLVGIYALFLTVMIISGVIVELVAEAQEAGEWLIPSEDFDDPTRPMDHMIGYGMLALLLPASILAMRWGGGRRGILHSVESRFRWHLFWRAGSVVFPLNTILITSMFFLFPPEDFAVPRLDSTFFIIIGISLVIVPLQSAGEEYLFRGVALQGLGRWFSSPLIPIIAPVPLFMVGHGYNWVGQVDIAVFALCIGALVWKTGGLELAVLLHTTNNLVLNLLSPLSPSIWEQGEIEPLGVAISVAFTAALTAGLWAWVSRLYGLGIWEPVTDQDRQRMTQPGPLTSV